MDKSLEIFQNNGSGFEFYQLLAFAATPNQLTVTNLSKVLVLCSDGFNIIEQDSDGVFASSMLLSLSSDFQCFLISRDEGTLIFGMGTKVEIFVKNGTGYTLDQTIAEGVLGDGLALSADEKELLFCSFSLAIYQHNGTKFLFKQSIQLGFLCLFTCFIGSLIELHGFDPSLRFYEFNGSEYVPKFNIMTNDTFLNEIGILGEEQKIMVGGDSKKASIFALNSNSSELVEQLDVGETIMEVFVDPNSLYFILATTHEIELLFRCPDECSAC